jgi:phosphate butyryltransferase
MQTRRTTSRLRDEQEASRTVSREPASIANDLPAFVHASGNLNPLHLPGLAAEAVQVWPIAPGIRGASLASAVPGDLLSWPGGPVYLSPTARLHGRAHPGGARMVQVAACAKPPHRAMRPDRRPERRPGAQITGPLVRSAAT